MTEGRTHVKITVIIHNTVQMSLYLLHLSLLHSASIPGTVTKCQAVARQMYTGVHTHQDTEPIFMQNTYAHTNTHIHTHTQIHTQHTHTHRYTHNTHTHTHTHTHTPTTASSANSGETWLAWCSRSNTSGRFRRGSRRQFPPTIPFLPLSPSQGSIITSGLR